MNSQPASTILVVDDDDDTRSSLAQILRLHGFHPLEAACGIEALRVTRDRPEAVVLDVRLPDIDGYEVCRRLKTDPATARTAVLMLSGWAIRSDDQTAGLDAGADAFLVKPAHPDLLVAQLKALIRGRRAEEMYRRAAAVLATTDECFASLDRNWRFTYLNPQAVRSFNRPRSEIIGRTLWEVFPDMVGSAFERAYRRALADRVAVTIEDYCPAAKAWFAVRAIPTDNGLDLLFRDVTETRQTAAERDALLTRLRLHIERLPLAYVLFDTESRVTDWNPAAERTFGYSRAEVIGMGPPFEKIIPPSSRSQAEEIFHRVQAGDMTAQATLENRTRDGRSIYCEWYNTPLIENGRFVGFLSLVHDVTDQKRLEAQFWQAQKMEAVGQLAGGVAHDFNNLLTVINGYSDLLLEALPATDPARELVAEMGRAGNRAARLTRQLLAFGRRAVLVPRILDPNALITDLEKMLRRLIGEDVELVVRLHPDSILVEADPGLLEQVVVNLCVNARDAMPTGGRLVVQTRTVRQEDLSPRPPPEARPGKYVQIAVSDTGTGIPADVLPHIFDPFFTTKGVGHGTGLGLATVHGIVRQAGGFITVRTEVEHGTTFEVYLPRAANPDGDTRSRSAIITPARGTETVLLVEDEESVRALSRIILQQAGYTVLEAAEGADALQVAAAHNAPIHLLLTDVVMPGMSGRELAEHLTRERPGLKVLFTSGYTDDAVVRHGVREENVAFLQKPFVPATLARKIRDVLDGQRA